MTERKKAPPHEHQYTPRSPNICRCDCGAVTHYHVFIRHHGVSKCDCGAVGEHAEPVRLCPVCGVQLPAGKQFHTPHCYDYHRRELQEKGLLWKDNV